MINYDKVTISYQKTTTSMIGGVHIYIGYTPHEKSGSKMT